jgi:hypothetical protein
MTMSPKTARLSVAAVTLAAALLAAPAAQASARPSPLAQGWERLVRLVAGQGLGLDPNGWKLRSWSVPRGVETPSGGARTAIARSDVRPR